MKTMGLDRAADQKCIVIMHGHADHFGGRQISQDEVPPARADGTAADWDMVARPPRPNAPRADGSAAELATWT